MYNRTPPYGMDYAISGSIMGRTLGYLALFLAIVAFSSMFSVEVGRAGLWLGILAVFGGTVMVNRNVRRGSGSVSWGIVVSVGMGLLVGPTIWSFAVSDPHVVISAIITLILAVALCAAMVAWIPWDFSRLAPMMMMSLILLVAAGFLSLLLPGLTGFVMSPLYNLIGVAVFTGYLLIDFSLLRGRGMPLNANGVAVMMATMIMVDIVNLFLFLLMLGRRR